MRLIDRYLKLTLSCLCLMLCSIAVLATPPSPVGYWQTTDESTQQPSSIVKISENKGVLEGKVVKLFTKPDAVCMKCSGEQHNKPIMGMTVLWNFSQLPDGGFSSGKILAVRHGMIFDADMALIDNGETLALSIKTGFRGNRVETWRRVKVE